MSTGSNISAELSHASVFKALAFLQYELSYINEKNTFVRYEKKRWIYYVYLDKETEAFQLINPQGQAITPVNLLEENIPITDFTAAAIGEKFSEFIEEYSGETPGLSPLTRSEFYMDLWQPRKKKNRQQDPLKPETIEALYDSAHHTCIMTKKPEQTNFLFVLDYESLSPFFKSNCYYEYGAKAAKIVLVHSYQDIMLAREYAMNFSVIIAHHEDLVAMNYLENLDEIIFPISTDAYGVGSAKRYYRQKLMELLALVQHYSAFDFQVTDLGNSFRLHIQHAEKKIIAKTLSAIMQHKNQDTNQLLKERHHLTSDAELRSFSQEGLVTGIEVDNKFYSVTMQYGACNILNLTRSLLPYVNDISVTLQDYYNQQ